MSERENFEKNSFHHFIYEKILDAYKQRQFRILFNNIKVAALNSQNSEPFLNSPVIKELEKYLKISDTLPIYLLEFLAYEIFSLMTSKDITNH